MMGRVRVRPRRSPRIGAVVWIALLAWMPSGALEAQDDGIFDRMFGRRTGSYERQAEPVMNAFAPVVAATRSSLVRIHDGDELVAWGAVVTEDGYVVTKRSELPKAPIVELPGGERVPAILVGEDAEFDLALLDCDASGLTPIAWSDEEIAPVGTFVVTPGADARPVAIGVVSVASRKIPRAIVTSRAYLGVQTEFVDDQLRLGAVLDGTPAAEAGLRAGDRLLEVNGVEMAAEDSLREVLAPLVPDDVIRVKLARAEEVLEKAITLTSRSMIERGRSWFQRRQTERLEGELSIRRGNFASAFQHDSVLRPEDCGGPILGLDGKALGINIARARRVASYAVPASEVKEFIAEALEHGLVSEPQSFDDRLDSLKDELGELEREIELLRRVRDLEGQIDQIETSLRSADASEREALERSLEEARTTLEKARDDLGRG